MNFYNRAVSIYNAFYSNTKRTAIVCGNVYAHVAGRMNEIQLNKCMVDVETLLVFS